MEIICTHTETGISATKARRYYAQRVRHHLRALSRPRRPVGPMRDGSGTGAPEPRALTAADTLHRQLQPLPPHPDRPMQRAPHLLRQAPGAPGPTRPPKQEKQAPISLSWAATRAGGRIAEAAVASTTAKAAQTAVSPEKYRAAIHGASLPTPKVVLSSPRMKPTACLDPRSARRRAKRGARRGAITAHRL